ncbi:MAG: MATE family efflux transporter [Caldisericia bacterium]|nr:MATE family efflux transporter [Caldisericia bacterium]
MSNPLNQKFNVKKLLKFALPTTLSMVFMAIYTMVDGFFVSNFVSENAFSAINIVFPAIAFVIAMGTMISTGGSAVVSMKLGEGKTEEAKENFTLVTLFGVLLSLIVAILGVVFTKEISSFLGSTALLDSYCHEYLVIVSCFIPFSILQIISQMFFVVEGKPNLGLFFGVAGGVLNIVLDYVFIVPLKMGISGAAIGTGLGICVSAFAFLIYFSKKRPGGLHFVKTKWDWKVLLSTCTNGASEMITNLAGTITTLLFNLTILKFAGESGVAAVGIVMYAQFLLISIFLGYSQGVAPIFGYLYGAQNHKQLKKIFRISMGVVILASILSYIISILGADVIIGLFVDKSSDAFGLAQHGFYLFSFSFILMGFNVFSSAMFTALSNGKISATISFVRTFLFVVVAIHVLPLIIGIDGVWLAVPVAEFAAVFVSIFFLVKQRKRYFG